MISSLPGSNIPALRWVMGHNALRASRSPTSSWSQIALILSNCVSNLDPGHSGDCIEIIPEKYHVAARELMGIYYIISRLCA